MSYVVSDGRRISAELADLSVGDPTPLFRLRHTFEESVDLARLLEEGPVLVVFYVFDFGEYWTAELSQLGHFAQDIRDLGAEPVAIAVTATFSQQAFARSLGVDFALLSDWDGEVAATYGARYDTWRGHAGVAKRSVFVIDREGTVRYRWQTDDAFVIPDFTEAIDVLRGLGS